MVDYKITIIYYQLRIFLYYLISLLREDSPCKAAKKVVLNVGKLKIHTLDMPTEADIENMWKNIYKHCIPYFGIFQ